MKRTSPVPQLDRETLLRVVNLSNAEARILVTAYYSFQENRKRADMQIRHLGDRQTDDSAPFLRYFADVNATTEDDVRKMLAKYADGHIVGRWMQRQLGVGPVIAAGFLAHIDIEKADAAGNIWSFAGQNPEQKWKKGEKRPYCPEMKQLVYHVGEEFKKVSNKPDSLYGSLYKSRKKFVVDRNEMGYNAERAKSFKTNSADVRKILATGKLPPFNLDRQACNFAAKIFLSHLHAVMYWHHYGKPPPKPYSTSILGHAHEIKIPDMDMFPGLEEAYYGSHREAAE